MAKKERQISITDVDPHITFGVTLNNSGDSWYDDECVLKVGSRGKVMLRVGCQRHSLAFWRSKRGQRLALRYAELDERPKVNREREKVYDGFDPITFDSKYRDETDKEYKDRVRREEREAAEYEAKKEQFIEEMNAILDAAEQAALYLQEIAKGARELTR